MFKRSGNPRIEELTKSYRDRSYNLSDLVVEKTENGRFCVWCNEVRLTHGNKKYCCKSCSINAMAWAYPQKEEGLGLLLMRQNWKCNICCYDYVPFVESILAVYRLHDKPTDFRTQFSWSLIKRLKSQIETAFRPEVDHIIPIYKGGESIGLSNHQAICYTCHKAKTSKDLSGKRK